MVKRRSSYTQQEQAHHEVFGLGLATCRRRERLVLRGKVRAELARAAGHDLGSLYCCVPPHHHFVLRV